MKLGYSIIKGYSKMSMKKGQYKDGKVAVYCGLDVNNLYVMGSLGWFYMTNGVDLDRAMTDNLDGLYGHPKRRHDKDYKQSCIYR